MELSSIVESTENFKLGSDKYRLVILQADNEKLTLPVTPNQYTVTSEQENHVVNILDFGENLLAGNAKLKHLKMKGFFPATFHFYSFVVGDKKEPAEIVDLLTNWKESNALIRVIITESPVNLLMMIRDFDFREKDGTRDIYFELNFDESRDWNVPPANFLKPADTQTGLKDRNTLSLNNVLQANWVKNAVDVLDRSKYAYGDFSSLDKFKTSNSISHLSDFKIGGWSW